MLKVLALMHGPMTVLSSVFSTLLVFNLIIASRVLGEAVTAPKVAGALLILTGAGVTTGATPQGVPKAYTPRDVRALLSAAPPYGWFIPLLFCVCVMVSVVGIVLLERHFPLGAEGELEPEHISAIESRMVIGPGELAQRLSPRLKRAPQDRWMTRASANAISNAASERAWRAFMAGASVATEEGAAGVAAGQAGAGHAGEGGHNCSLETAASVLHPPPPHPSPEHPCASSLSRDPGGVLGTSALNLKHALNLRLSRAHGEPAQATVDESEAAVHVGSAHGRQPESPLAASPAAPPPSAAPATPRMQPDSSPPRHFRPPPSPRSYARRADSPLQGSVAQPQPATRPPFAWLLGARTPRPLPAWAEPLVATGYAAALGLDEALADLCVRAYSSMLTTCDRPEAGCWDGWALYVFALVGTAAGLASALFYMPLVYRRCETTARPMHCTRRCTMPCTIHLTQVRGNYRHV